MKVAFVGNQDNNAYRICRWLREAGAAAHLYLIRQERGPRSFPEFVDTSLAGNYPDWIRQYDDKGRLSFLLPSKLARRVDREYDVVVTSGATGLLSANHFRHAPVVHLTLGSEVNDFPMRLFKLRAGGPRWQAAAWLMRRCLRRVNKIVTHGFWPEMRALAALGHLDKTVIWGFPEDARENRDRVGPELLAELNRACDACERVFVWLGRVNYLDKSDVEYKAPEVFLEAMRKLAIDDGRDVRAIVGEHGKDIDEFKRLVAEQGLTGRVRFVPHMDYWKVLTHFSVTNGVVVDVPEMEHGHIIGGLVREALSVGAVVIAAWDEQLVGLCYGEGCPVLRATDVNSCYAAMKHTADMSREELAALKQRSAEWADKHLHYERRIGELVSLLRQTIYCGSFGPGGDGKPHGRIG